MITVVVPVYNTGKWLPRCIDSLLKQTYNDYEILVVDDGSTDGSSEVCDLQKKRSNKISVFHKENGGVSSARNLGIEHAKGDYIIFPDPDDWVEPDYLEKLLIDREKNGADLTICGYYRSTLVGDTFNLDKNVKTCLNNKDALLLLVKPKAYQGFVWNKLFSMAVIRENNLRFNEELKAVQDLHFAVRYFLLCNTVYFDTTPLYHYSTDTNGVTTFKKCGEREISGIRSFEKLSKLLHNVNPAAEKEVRTSLCGWALLVMNAYFRTNMHDQKILNFLCKKFRSNLFYYFNSERYSRRQKIGGSVAAFSPRLYYHLLCRYGYQARQNRMKKKS